MAKVTEISGKAMIPGVQFDDTNKRYVNANDPGVVLIRERDTVTGKTVHRT